MQHYSYFISILFVSAGISILSQFNSISHQSPLLSFTMTSLNIHQISPEMLDGKQIEVNRLQFKAFLSDSKVGEKDIVVSQKYDFFIPKESQSSEQRNWMPIYLVVQIRNTTEKPIYFSRFGSVKLDLIDENNKIVTQNKDFIQPIFYGAMLIEPGENANFVLPGGLTWENERIGMYLTHCSTCPISFSDMKPGRYHLQLTYSNYQDKVSKPKLDPRQFSTLENPEPEDLPSISSRPSIVKQSIWKGQVACLPIEFHLIRALP